MKKWMVMGLAAGLFACNDGKKNTEGRYVLAVEVETYERKGADALVEKLETDTVSAPSPLGAYSKGVQKFASVLMHIQQFPDSIKGTAGLRILDEKGQDVLPSIPQHQRDSTIMNFIQFARRSTIPYYERVKDFELKLMTIR